jgi:hypothetical protein
MQKIKNLKIEQKLTRSKSAQRNIKKKERGQKTKKCKELNCIVKVF